MDLFIDGVKWNLPKDWKEVLGEEVLNGRLPISYRIKELGININYFNRIVKNDEIAYAGISELRKRFPQQSILHSVRSADFKEKVLEKRRATNLSRYGVENPFDSKVFQDKKKATFIERYGSDNPLKIEKFREKALETIKHKYPNGVMRDSTVYSKYKDTCIKARGVHQSKMKKPEEIFELSLLYGIRPLEQVYTFEQHYRAICLTCGREFVSYFNSDGKRTRPVQCPFCSTKTTRLETYVSNLLEKSGYEIRRHVFSIFKDTEVYRKEIDIYIPSLRLGIEINGVFSHNSTRSFYNNCKPKPRDYHLKKTLAAISKGVELIHLWEHRHEDLDFLELRLSGKHLNFDSYILKDEFYLRRDYYPVCPDIQGFSVNLEEEVFKTDRGGREDTSKEELLTFTSGLWHFIKK